VSLRRLRLASGCPPAPSSSSSRWCGSNRGVGRAFLRDTGRCASVPPPLPRPATHGEIRRLHPGTSAAFTPGAGALMGYQAA
jgi:hypothetical protein